MLNIPARLWIASFLFSIAIATALDTDARDFGKLNPEAPPETAQFAFMVGEWDCKTRFMKPDGSGYGEGRAKWTAYFILDGWALQDEWISSLPNGGKAHGTNIRSFNPETRQWDNRWLSSGNLQWKYFSAEKVGDTMVMTGEGRDGRGPFVDRNVFYEITADHWKWRKDRSWDGGKTWIEGIGYIDAKRAGKKTGSEPKAESP